MNDVFLVGFMGSGKSTVGPLLAERLHMPFVDLDARIVAEQGRPIADLFAEGGESYFRGLEHDALASLTATEPAVIACGGGIVTREDSRELLGRLGTVVYLRTTAAETLSRISDRSSRPLLSGPNAAEDARDLLEARSALYEAVADIEIDTVGARPLRLAERIAAMIAARESA